jgi:hypothetical protein
MLLVSCSTDGSRSTPELCVSLGRFAIIPAVKRTGDTAGPDGLADFVPEYRSHRKSAFGHGRTRGANVPPDPPVTPCW